MIKTILMIIGIVVVVFLSLFYILLTVIIKAVDKLDKHTIYDEQ